MDLLGALFFHYPPGAAWRVVVPLLALAWTLGFGLGVPVAVRRLRTWADDDLRRAAWFAWWAVSPSLIVTAEYVVRVALRATTEGATMRSPAWLFVGSIATPFFAMWSFGARGPTKGPLSFQLVRGAYEVAWLVSCGLWWAGMAVACVTV
jgi:hypothetical protein